MEKLLLTVCLAMANCAVLAEHKAVKLRTEQDINAHVAKMTLEEKVGQMTELVIDVIGHWENGNFVLDNDKLERALVKYKVGSILNAPGPVAQTPEWWQKTIRTINEYSIRGCGIPCVYGLDQNHGTTYTLGGTLFPQNINVGASFNPELARKAATITAYETRASNCPWTYSPTVDLSRDPRWPRVWENFGEDCLVNATMGKAMIEGFQGTGKNIDRYHIGTSVKHTQLRSRIRVTRKTFCSLQSMCQGWCDLRYGELWFCKRNTHAHQCQIPYAMAQGRDWLGWYDCHRLG